MGGALNRTLGWRGRPMLESPLPEGTRWVDIWSVHDPVPMGSLDRDLIATSGVAAEEVRVANTLTPIVAHTTYWQNAPEVIATIAEELASAGPPAIFPPDPGPKATPPLDWQTPREGLWAWRPRHGRSDQPCARWRQAVVLDVLAVVRASAYLGIAAVTAGLALMTEGEALTRAGMATAGGLGAATAYVVTFTPLEAVVLAAGRWWTNRPCRHTSALRDRQ